TPGGRPRWRARCTCIRRPRATAWPGSASCWATSTIPSGASRWRSRSARVTRSAGLQRDDGDPAPARASLVGLVPRVVVVHLRPGVLALRALELAGAVRPARAATRQKLHIGVRAHVVVPRRVPRRARVRGDQQDALAVAAVE